MQTTEQASLAQRLLANDEQVLDEVMRTYGPVILGVLTRRYRSVLRETDIEDVMSIGLFRLWQHRSRFDARQASLKVWFFRIVENAARDVLRLGWHKARMLEVSSESAVPGMTEAKCRTTGPVLPAEEFSDAVDHVPTSLELDLRDIVAELPQKQQLIVMADAATRTGTASSQRLGDELDLPPATVRVYRKRAMDRIRSQLSKRGYDVPGTKSS